MAGLERLRASMYHEMQQPGSMLCAQHALNSLLQGNYFTVPDLSEIAHTLDLLEQSYNEDSRGRGSTNMDDTGFFSVQVLENALNVWGLRLARWRSEAMKPYQGNPHLQLAFILNQNQHWYTLRRFGHSAADSHWFNLDSMQPHPAWIGKMYLGMVLQQAEQEGYSVFVVIPSDSSGPQGLPHSDADDLASTLPDPSMAAPSTSRGQAASSETGLEDEDMELQAALQASLMSGNGGNMDRQTSARGMRSNHTPPVIPAVRTFPGFTGGANSAVGPSQLGTSGQAIPPNQDPYGNADADPVTASMERNRVIMERMRREQEVALREQYEEEVARFGEGQRWTSEPRRGEDVDDEDELFRRAMAESLTERDTRRQNDERDDDGGEGYELSPTFRSSGHSMNRVYDDDDAELQAALKASLESAPHGFTLPPSPLRPSAQRLVNPAPSTVLHTAEKEKDESGIDTESEADASTSSAAPLAEEVDVQEMRRRRLAKFGG
ncbi:Josephin-domain-containing protein [Phlebopus sp. FC_14]|nr:Josephin-domain-containing protein [Phlebopus sp. FC_14]